MKKSITRKMIFVFFLFLCILMVGTAAMNLLFFKGFKIWQNERKMIEQGQAIAEHFDSIEMNRNSIKDYEDELSEATETYNFTMRIVNNNYDVIIDSTGMHSGSKNKLVKQTIDLIEKHTEEINENQYCIITLKGQVSGNPHILYVRRLSDKYLLTISRTIKSIDEDIETSNIFLLISGGIVSVLGIVIIYLFARSFTQPILKINQAAQRISCLDFSVRIPVTSQDELGELSESMNQISDKLNESICQLKSDLDKRNQLVRDMSHELKTPITAIKGYSEALKYGVAKNQEQKDNYYDIIVQECDRMNLLIHEMIELSKMDSLEDAMNVETFDIENVLIDLKQQYQYEMEKKSVEFQLEIKDKQVTGDLRILKRAIKNILENAVRYVNENGRIKILGERKEQQYLLKIYNTGSSIPKESIAAVWDVFYKVDESRKREKNTYGIGLAIVKSAIELHHGRVEVENLEDGVEFRIYLPTQL